MAVTGDPVAEITSKAPEEWAQQHGVKVDVIYRRKPTETGTSRAAMADCAMNA